MKLDVIINLFIILKNPDAQALGSFPGKRHFLTSIVYIPIIIFFTISILTSYANERRQLLNKEI